MYEKEKILIFIRVCYSLLRYLVKSMRVTSVLMLSRAFFKDDRVKSANSANHRELRHLKIRFTIAPTLNVFLSGIELIPLRGAAYLSLANQFPAQVLHD